MDMCQCKFQSKLLYVCNTKRQQNIALRYITHSLMWLYAVDRHVDILSY